MSCIAGIFSPEGPASGEVLAAMVSVMRPRAPDGVLTHVDAPAALACAFLATGASPAEQAGAMTLDGATWIACDARIDDRIGTTRRLRDRGRAVHADAPAAEILLHAYAVFGERLVDHVIGDFAFAIWDVAKRRLFCARDHLGVRPLHYAVRGRTLYLASDVEALLAVPGMPTELDDASLVDFILMGSPLDPDKTMFRHIAALPPASTLTVDSGGHRIDRYWHPGPAPELRLRTRRDYVDGFREVFRAAVADRMPAGPAGIALTAGMDSSSIAAMAAQVRHGRPSQLVAFHHTIERLVPEDDERPLAQETARRLGIDLLCHDLADTPLFAEAGTPQLCVTQPVGTPHLAVHRRTMALLQSSGARVFLSGYMGDAVLANDTGYFAGLLRRGRVVTFMREAAHHLRVTASTRGLALRNVFASGHRSPGWRPAMPDWIAPQPMRSRLEHSWSELWRLHETSWTGTQQLALPWISRQFAALEILPSPLVWRYPFLDLRVIGFLAAIPTGLLVDKRILREAMAGLLPEAVLQRPKRGAPGDIVRTMVTNGIFGSEAGAMPLPPQVDAEAFGRAWQRYCNGEGADSTWMSGLLMQTVALGFWLANNPVKHRSNEDGRRPTGPEAIS